MGHGTLAFFAASPLQGPTISSSFAALCALAVLLSPRTESSATQPFKSHVERY
jgi:hypothetical protein